MITFTKEMTDLGRTFGCYTPTGCIGYISVGPDKFYQFYPIAPDEPISSSELKEIIAKLQSLNEPVVQKALAEAIEEEAPAHMD